MRNFPDTFETRKQSFINAFSIYMTVPLKFVKNFKKIVILFHNGKGKGCLNLDIYYTNSHIELNLKRYPSRHMTSFLRL